MKSVSGELSFMRSGVCLTRASFLLFLVVVVEGDVEGQTTQGQHECSCAVVWWGTIHAKVLMLRAKARWELLISIVEIDLSILVFYGYRFPKALNFGKHIGRSYIRPYKCCNLQVQNDVLIITKIEKLHLAIIHGAESDWLRLHLYLRPASGEGTIPLVKLQCPAMSAIECKSLSLPST